MFTVLVEEIGTILCRELTRLLIHAPSGFADVTCNERLAVDGAALAIIERGEIGFMCRACQRSCVAAGRTCQSGMRASV